MTWPEFVGAQFGIAVYVIGIWWIYRTPKGR